MTEPTYTLAEARQELARQECLRDGHSYYTIGAPSHTDPAGTPAEVVCDQCGKHWPVARPQRDTEIIVDIGADTELDFDIANYLRRYQKTGYPGGSVTSALRKEQP